MKSWVLILVLAASAMLPGCFKLKQEVTVMPDGSGKLSMTIGWNKKQLDDAFKGMPMGQPPKQADPTDIDLESFAGFVAFTAAEEWTTEDGWKYSKFTGYFEDINKVKIFHVANREGEKKAWLSFTFKKEKDGGFHLECVDTLNTNAEQTKKADQIPTEMEDMVLPTIEAAMKGMNLERSFLMPGEVTKAEDCTEKKGRVASNVLASKDMKGMSDFRKLGENKHYKITCGKSVVTDIEAAAFRAELDEAVEKWEELKKKAEKEKAEKEKAEKAAEENKAAEEKKKAAEDK